MISNRDRAFIYVCMYIHAKYGVRFDPWRRGDIGYLDLADFEREELSASTRCPLFITELFGHGLQPRT